MPAEAVRASRWVHGCAFLLAAALLAAPWAGHVDDTDAQLYQVVARHMVEDGTWTDLRYLPDVHAQFREHLPFGLWPMALAIRLGGEGWLAPLTALWSLGILLVTAWLGRRLLGRGEALVAVLVLALCESFFRYGGRPRLDPPLVLFSLLAAAPLLLPRLRARGWALATLAGAVAALIKGPFGVLPLLAVTAATAWEARSWRRLLAGGLAAALALLPVAAFLARNHVAGDGSWWEGYGRHQLLASASGARADGALQWWFPLTTIARRFWPGFPLLLVALGLRLRAPGG
ncbi:MAG TPA: glycosyltransferase family 39 protein, partial [Aggregicoccus sp.]|nr:glycosyltransferase family 39 protein [Aggregicoccus sp.]